MKIIFAAAFVFYSSVSFSQNVGIGIATPDEKLQVDSIIRVGKNEVIPQGSLRQNLIKFGDGNFTTIGEQQKDDRLVLNAGSFSFTTGKVGIGVDSAREMLDVNGGIIIRNSSSNIAGAIRYNAASAALEYRDSEKWNSTKNTYLTKTSYFFEDTSRNIEVNVAQTDLIIPDAGTYLVNYYVNAYNTYFLSGTPTYTFDKYVYRTDVYLYEKNSSTLFQRMKIDNIEISSGGTGEGYAEYFRLPSHEISGVVVMQLLANSKVGIKLKQRTDTNGFGKMRIEQCIITAVKLY